MKVRVFDVETKEEVDEHPWSADNNDEWNTFIHKNFVKEGDTVFYIAYRNICKVVQNSDREEVFVYWQTIIGYDVFMTLNKIK